MGNFFLITAKTINLTQKEIEFNASHLIISLALHSIPVQYCQGCSSVDGCVPKLEEVRKVAEFGDFPSGPAVRTPNSPFRGRGSIPGQGTTRSCLLQLRSRAAKLKKEEEEELLPLEPGLPDAL